HWDGRRRPQLLAAAQQFLWRQFIQYRIDILVAQTGREFKSYVASNNKTFKLLEVKTLFNEDLGQITVQNWQNCISHVLRQENMYGLDNAIEEMELAFVVNTDSSDESDVEWDIETEDVTEVDDNFSFN
ncbi:hypothetical protein BDFB_013344, partial [Asbolus verrucosus]